MKYLMITSMRNEAPYILEWLAYHRSIGVDGFLIYSNDCDDATSSSYSIWFEISATPAPVTEPIL